MQRDAAAVSIVRGVTAEASLGVFHVQFADGFFNNVPCVTLTQIYNGSDGSILNPISCDGGDENGGWCSIICIDKNLCRIKTRADNGGVRYRSFCLQAIGN
jgi:hypothetical protein